MDLEVAAKLSLKRYKEVLVNSDDEAWRHVPAAGVHVEEPDGSTVFLWREENDWITWALCEPYVYENPLYLSMSVLAYGTGSTGLR